MDSLRRPLRELPGDPEELVLSFEQTSHLLAAEGSDAVDAWTVTVVARRLRGRTAQAEIGSMRLYRLRRNSPSGFSPLHQAESECMALYQLALSLFDWDSSYRPRFREMVVEPDGDVLVVHHVRLDKAWRGFGLEAALAAEAVWTPADGCCAVVADLYGNSCPDHGLRPGGPWPAQSTQTIGAVWESIGFRKLPALYLLDTAAQEPRELRKRARAALVGLGEGFKASFRE